MRYINKFKIIDLNNICIKHNNKYREVIEKNTYIAIKKEKYIKYYRKHIFFYENSIIELINLNGMYENKDFIDINKNIQDNSIVFLVVKILDQEEFSKALFITDYLLKRKNKLINIIYTNEEYSNLLKKENKFNDIVCFIEKNKSLEKQSQQYINSLSTKFILTTLINGINKKEEFYKYLNKKYKLTFFSLKVKDKNSIGEAVLYVLNNYKDFQYCDEFIIGVFNNDNVSIDEISYFLDPLEEYMKLKAKITLKDIKEQKLDCYLFINFIGIIKN